MKSLICSVDSAVAWWRLCEAVAVSPWAKSEQRWMDRGEAGGLNAETEAEEKGELS